MKLLNKYFMILKASIQNATAYIGEFVYRSLFIVVLMFIFIKLWNVVYSGNNVDGEFSYEQLIWYLVMTETIQLSKLSVTRIISNEVISGGLAYTMGKPYNYISYMFFNNFGESLVRLIINFKAGSIVALIMVGPISINIQVVIPVLFTILLAFVLDFFLSSIIGLLSFYTEDISGFEFVYQKILFILGGLMIPIEFFPGWLSKLCKYTPFNLILYGPSKLFVNYSIELFIELVTKQLLWILILGIVVALIYIGGTRRLSVNGG